MNKEFWQIIYIWLIPIIWIIWWGYWFISSRNIDKSTKSESSVSRTIHLFLVGVGFILIFIPFFRIWPLGLRWLPKIHFIFSIGVAVLIVSLAFAVRARRQLGQYWSGTIGVKEKHQLIRSGPYSLVRHPIYTGFVGGMLGTAIAYGELRCILAVLLLIIAYLRKISIEEKWLIEYFGQIYLDYRKEVKALIPFLI